VGRGTKGDTGCDGGKYEGVASANPGLNTGPGPGGGEVGTKCAALPDRRDGVERWPLWNCCGVTGVAGRYDVSMVGFSRASFAASLIATRAVK